MKQTVFVAILMCLSTSVFGMSTESLERLRPESKKVCATGIDVATGKFGDPVPSSSNSGVNFDDLKRKTFGEVGTNLHNSGANSNTRKRKVVEVIEIDDEDDTSKKACVSRDIFTYVGENLPIEPKDKCDIYSQYHYELVKNHMVGFSTPTTVLVYPKGNPKIWSDIREIHYSHDVSSQCLVNPKVSFFRNRNNTCNILLNGMNVIHGINERHIVTQNNSFATYEVLLEYLDSFLDNISRRIYIDITGLYIVPEENNSMQDIIARYEKKGRLEFKNPASVVKVSASTGDMTVGDKPVTDNNFAEKSHGEASLINTESVFQKFSNIPYSYNIVGLPGCVAGYRSSSHGAFVYSAYYEELIEEFVQKKIIEGKALRRKLEKKECEQFILYGFLYSWFQKSSSRSDSLGSFIELTLREFGYDSSGYERALKNPNAVRNFQCAVSKFSSTKFEKTEDATIYAIIMNL